MNEIECIHRLRRAEWICKLSDYYTEPFMIITPDHPVDADVTDEEVIERFRRLLPIREQQRIAEKVIPRLPELNDDTYALLCHVNSHPFRGTSDRIKMLEMSGRRFIKARNQLTQLGLIGEIDILLGPNRPKKFLTPSDKALGLLEAKGNDIRYWKHIGRVGFEHILYQTLLRLAYTRRGCEVRNEAKISEDRIVDVLVVEGEKKIGIEIELTTSYNLKEKLRGIESLDELHILVENEKTLLESEKKLDEKTVPTAIRLFIANQYLQRIIRQ